MILTQLVHNTQFLRKVIPFIKEEYFQDHCNKTIFRTIESYVSNYAKNPSVDILLVALETDKSLSQDMFDTAKRSLESYKPVEENIDWLCDETEKFCQDRSIYNAVLKSISIIDGKEDDLTPQALPQILSEALSVSFDSNIGHNYYDNADDRYEFYHRDEERIPFDIDLLNKVTNGGLPNKSIMCWLASTGVGKSLVMCHQAAAAMSMGRNVLYITLEMSEERIAERIDANLMDVDIRKIDKLDKRQFQNKISNIKKRCHGKLIIKEYPTSTAHAGNFEHLLDELKIKKNFKPDIIFIDYINLCTSRRLKNANGVNSYTMIKSIAEELRGLSVTQNVPLVTATQVNRSGADDPDLDLTNTAESFGLPATVDLMLALISTEELEGQNQLMIKQLKNRYNDLSSFKRFVVGIDRPKMRLYDLDTSAQSGITPISGGGQPAKGFESKFANTAEKTYRSLIV